MIEENFLSTTPDSTGATQIITPETIKGPEDLLTENRSFVERVKEMFALLKNEPIKMPYSHPPLIFLSRLPELEDKVAAFK